MRHKFLVLPVKKLLKSVHIYGSYRKIKTGVPFFLEHPVYIDLLSNTALNYWCHQSEAFILLMAAECPSITFDRMVLDQKNGCSGVQI